MSWEEIIRDEINKLEKENALKKLDRLGNDVNWRNFSKMVERMADINSITDTITELYILLGRSGEVNN